MTRATHRASTLRVATPHNATLSFIPTQLGALPRNAPRRVASQLNAMKG